MYDDLVCRAKFKAIILWLTRQLFAESCGVTDARMLVSTCASLMHKWGMWELFFVIYLYILKTRLQTNCSCLLWNNVQWRSLEGSCTGVCIRSLPLPLVPNGSSIVKHISILIVQSIKTLSLNAPARKYRTSVPVLLGPPGKSGRSHTVGSDPAETESTGRMHPGPDLQQRVQVLCVGFVCSCLYKRISDVGFSPYPCGCPP